MSEVNLSWEALDALAEDLVGCSGPDDLGESISCSCVSDILGMRKKTCFVLLMHRKSMRLSCFLLLLFLLISSSFQRGPLPEARPFALTSLLRWQSNK